MKARWAITGVLTLAAAGWAEEPAGDGRPASAPATAVTTQASSPSLSAATSARLEELDARIAQVRDLTTRFRQAKHTALTRKPIISSGSIRVKGSVILWETEKPAASVMRIDEKELRVFYPREKTLEVYRLDQQMAKMAASPLPRLSLLRENFEIGEQPHQQVNSPTLVLELVPRQASLREHVARITVVLDVSAGHMRSMEMVDPDGERTELTFEDVRMNRGIKDEDLQLRTPADVKVVRPLEALEAGQAP